MAVSLGSNITSLLAQRGLAKASDTQSRVFERLSSGQRINRASDDAAGLSIASTLKADSRVLNQAVRNINDGISFASIADGMLQQLTTIVTRQLELAEQAATGTYATTQRQAMSREANALVAEYNRIVEGTTFNGVQIYSSTNSAVSIQASTTSANNLELSLGDALGRNAGDGTFAAGASYAAGGADPFSILAGDFNNDGNQDLSYLSYTSGTFSLLMGNGNGTFSLGQSIDYPSAIRGLDVGDVNNDGYEDFTFIGDATRNVSVLLGNSNGTFSVANSFVGSPVGSSPSTTHLADINGDGR
jgi:flagellin-like hook-associated protein FlgL